ncbi:hypothetical protein VPH35_064854 [Triticum aestivum]
MQGNSGSGAAVRGGLDRGREAGSSEGGMDSADAATCRRAAAAGLDPVDGQPPDQFGSPAAALRPHPGLDRQQHCSLPPSPALDWQQQRRWIQPPARATKGLTPATNCPHRVWVSHRCQF